MIRVVIADDHGVVRGGLSQLVSAAGDIEVVAVAGGGREAVEAIDRERPDVVLMDLSMPDLDGIAATREALARAPATHIVILTSFSDRQKVVEAVEAGAVGYLLKDAEPEELLQGIRAAARGESPFTPKAAVALVASHRGDPDRDPGPAPAGADVLTPREREILRLVAEGRSNKVIARELDIAEQTVKNHLSRIFLTIGVTDRTQAALWATRNGLG